MTSLPVRSTAIDSPLTNPGEEKRTEAHLAAQSSSEIMRDCRRRLMVVYMLFGVEQLSRLFQPALLGLAITELIAGQRGRFYLYCGLLTTQAVVNLFRRMYDTRVFVRLQQQLSTQAAFQVCGNPVQVSQASARTRLVQDVVNFLERDLCAALTILFSIGGATIALALYDLRFLPIGLLGGTVAFLCARQYSRQAQMVNQERHDQLEQEIDILSTGHRLGIANHFQQLGHWQILQSDRNALMTGILEGMMILAVLCVISIYCTVPNRSVGQLVAIFRYLTMLGAGLSSLPMLIEQFARLRDIRTRL